MSADIAAIRNIGFAASSSLLSESPLALIIAWPAISPWLVVIESFVSSISGELLISIGSVFIIWAEIISVSYTPSLFWLSAIDACISSNAALSTFLISSS